MENKAKEENLNNFSSFDINYKYPLLRNVHLKLPLPATEGTTHLTRDADVIYFHYGCDGHHDNGWGCAYRTLQSMCAWLAQKGQISAKISVPSLREIQEILVRIGDKPASFVGSRDWIGAMEVFYVIDDLYGVPCKILHISRAEDLKKYANILKKYFEDYGGFVMMGGDVDAASKGIAGIHISGNQAYFLIVDPHFTGIPKSTEELIELGYLRWQHSSEFVNSSFYNLCLPTVK